MLINEVQFINLIFKITNVFFFQEVFSKKFLKEYCLQLKKSKLIFIKNNINCAQISVKRHQSSSHLQKKIIPKSQKYFKKIERQMDSDSRFFFQQDEFFQDQIIQPKNLASTQLQQQQFQASGEKIEIQELEKKKKVKDRNDQNMIKKFNGEASNALRSLEINVKFYIQKNKLKKHNYSFFITHLIIAHGYGKFNDFKELYQKGIENVRIKSQKNKMDDFVKLRNKVSNAIGVFQNEGAKEAFISLFSKKKKKKGSSNSRAMDLFDKVQGQVKAGVSKQFLH